MAKTGHPNVVLLHGCYWRGSPHVWSTVYNLSGSTPNAADQVQLIRQLRDIESSILFGGNGGTARGFIEGRFYTGQGGIPTAVDTYGTKADPASWLSYTGIVWGATSAPYEETREVAMLIKTPLNGLSSRGKPVFLRKYFHAIPFFADNGQIPSSFVTLINNAVLPWTNGSLHNGVVVIGQSGRQSSLPPATDTFTVARQMPRGRRKKVTATPASVAAAFSRLTLVDQAQALALESVSGSSGVA